MTIATTTQLRAAIATWSHKSNLTTEIPDFIMLAEKRISKLLRARLQEIAGTISTVAGQAYATLPSTLLGIESLTIPAVSPTIDFVSSEQYDRDYSDTSYTGAPREYNTVGGLIYFGPVPDRVYSVKVTYRASLTPLSDTVDANDLLTKWPDVYLFGSLVEAADFCNDDVAKAKWEAKFLAAIDGINLLDWNVGGTMRVRTDVCM